jgi:hypothetical protein
MKSKKSIVLIINIILLCNNYLFSQDENFHYIEFGDKGTNEYLFNPTSKSIPSFTQDIREFNNLLEIQADFKMAYIWIYNDTGFEIFDQIDTNFATFSLPSGFYNIFTGHIPENNHHLFITKEQVDVTSYNQIKLTDKDAIYNNSYVFFKNNSDTLNISTINLIFINSLIGPNLNIRHRNIDSNNFLVKHNTLPDYFEGEWAVKGKPEFNNYNLYLLNNSLFFFENDTIISNNINNFVYADIDYYLPDSIQDSTSKQIFTYIPDNHRFGNGDIFYNSSLKERIFQDTSADKSLRTSKFWQSVSVNSMPYYFLFTSEIRFSIDKIQGYHFRDEDSAQFCISDTNYVKLGQPPFYWFGKFSNSIDTIKIRSSYGKGEFLFFTQTNDLPRHFPIQYNIFNDSIKVDSGDFDLRFGLPGLRIGFDPDDLTIPIQPGEYTIHVKDDFNQISNLKGFSEVNASFDLNKVDKNPPNIVSFQLLSGKKITHKFYNNSNNKIRLIAEDNVLLDSISLNYSHLNDTMKFEIPLTFNDPYYEGFLPELPPGYFNLHTYIMDNSQNYIECNMSPAFVVDSSVLAVDQPTIISNEFKLFQNYPNPFNSSTVIPFEIPLNFRDNVIIEVYNILGQKVKTLYNGYAKNTIKSVLWNGSNDNNNSVSSGIYFINLRGGDVKKIIKVILLN